MITPEEMREWTAMAMGWKLGTTSVRNSYTGIATHEPAWIDEHGTHEFFVVDWIPDTDLNQCFMLVDRMRGLGFNYLLEWHQKYHKSYFAVFWINPTGEGVDKSTGKGFNINPCHAIILAAMATEGK